MPYPNSIAQGITEEGGENPFHLWAGDAPIVTDRATTGATPLEQFEVFQYNALGIAVPWDGETGTPDGFAAQPIAANTTGPTYVSGAPNHEALLWPEDIDTLALRRLAFRGTPIHPMELYG